MDEVRGGGKLTIPHFWVGGNMSFSFISPLVINPAKTFQTLSVSLDTCPRHRRVRKQLHATLAESDGIQQPDKVLTADEQAVAVSTIRTSQTLFASSEDDPLTLPTLSLLSYCTVKGLPLRSNPWDRVALLQQARVYQSDERLARLSTGPQWDTLVHSKKLRLLHAVCNAEGDATYTDPESGYTVFSAFAHLRRGHCCGVFTNREGGFERTHRCRHCPYTNDGAIGSSSVQALKDRLHVIQYVRQNHVRDWWSLPVPQQSSLHSGDSIASTKPSPVDCFDSDEKHRKNVPSQDLFNTIAGDAENEARLRRKLVKRVVLNAPAREGAACDVCGDEQMTTCTRCNGWTCVFSPRIQTCSQCKGEGMHPCMQCTPFRPPATTSIYS